MEHIRALALSHTHKWDFCIIASLLSGIIDYLFGGWTLEMSILLTVMAIDFFTGVIVAGIFKKSPKTNGGLKSDVGIKGIFKKVLIIILVSVLHLIDVFFGYPHDYLMNMSVVAFFCMESISIIENIGLVIDLPPFITKAIAILNEKSKAGVDNENITDRNQSD